MQKRQHRTWASKPLPLGGSRAGFAAVADARFPGLDAASRELRRFQREEPVGGERAAETGDAPSAGRALSTEFRKFSRSLGSAH